MNNKYLLMVLAVSAAVCILRYIFFGRKRRSTLKSVLIAILAAAATVGRVVFAVTAAFKPVTAIVIAAGAALGIDAGFMTGTLAAALSGMYFGQGPWTFFEMAAWGTIGIVSGLLGKYIQGSKAAMYAWGVSSGLLYSVIMEIYTMLAMGDEISLGKYLLCLATGMPTTAIYAVSNVVFLALAGDFVIRKLARIKRKYFV